MTDNIRPISSAQKAAVKPAGKSVTIYNGDNWGIRFSDAAPQLMMGKKTVNRLVEATEKKIMARRVAPASVPATNPDQERTSLIDLLKLDDDTVARLDSNARLLGLSFADAVAGELVQ